MVEIGRKLGAISKFLERCFYACVCVCLLAQHAQCVKVILSLEKQEFKEL